MRICRDADITRGWFSLPVIEFEMGMDREGRMIGVNKGLKLVVKIFSEEDEFSREDRAYQALSKNGCRYIPTFYGSFHNESVDLWALVISYETPVGEEFRMTPRDRQDFQFSLNIFACLNKYCIQGGPGSCSKQPP
jgi:hypothetical protein